MAKLWQLDYGYKVKTLTGENQGKKGYVTGIVDTAKIKINLDKEPFAGEHHITEHMSNLEVISTKNPHEIWDTETIKKKKQGGYELTDKINEMTPFFYAKIKEIAHNPENVITNSKYFSKEDIILAEKQIQKERKKYKGKVSKKEVRQEVSSLIKRLNKEDNNFN